MDEHYINISEKINFGMGNSIWKRMSRTEQTDYRDVEGDHTHWN
jgi:hypothetical protein